MVKDLLVHERSCPERTVECPDPDNNCGAIVEILFFFIVYRFVWLGGLKHWKRKDLCGLWI